MVFHLGIRHLHIIHYYFFVAGLLSLLAVFLTWNSLPVYGAAFVILNALHFALSFYISWVILGRLKHYIIFSFGQYVTEHIAVIAMTITFGAIVFAFSDRAAFFSYMLFLDVFVLASGGLAYAFSKMKAVGGIFSIGLPVSLEKAGKEALSLGRKWGFPIPAEFEAYRPGQDREIDSILMLLGSREGKERLFWVVRELYLGIYAKKRKEIEKWLSEPGRGRKEMAELEGIREKYQRMELEARQRKPD